MPRAAGGPVPPGPLREPPLGPARHAALPARLFDHVEGTGGTAGVSCRIKSAQNFATTHKTHLRAANGPVPPGLLQELLLGPAA